MFHIRANAYRLSGQGLVSSIIGSCGPPLSAYRICTPSIIRNWGLIAAVSEVFMANSFRVWLSALTSAAGLVVGLLIIGRRSVVAGLDRPDAVHERLLQDALADGPEHEASNRPLRFLP